MCNNAFDDVPTWEDATIAVLRGTNHVFSNKSFLADKPGVNIRITMKRNEAIGDCYVSGFNGKFE